IGHPNPTPAHPRAPVCWISAVLGEVVAGETRRRSVRREQDELLADTGSSCSTGGSLRLLRLQLDALLDLATLVKLAKQIRGRLIIEAAEQFSGVSVELRQRNDASGAGQLEQCPARHPQTVPESDHRKAGDSARLLEAMSQRVRKRAADPQHRGCFLDREQQREPRRRGPVLDRHHAHKPQPSPPVRPQNLAWGAQAPATIRPPGRVDARVNTTP
ncbi:MAG: hypothetical protein ACRDZ2_16705, partial [Ilumatobacteraceae bacterium]